MKPTRIRAVLFDLDHVLYLPDDFLHIALPVTVQSMIQHGLNASQQEALSALYEIRAEDPNANDHLDRLCMHFNGHHDNVIIAAGVEKYWECKVGNMMPAEGAHEVLTELRKHYLIGVISNGDPLKQAGKLFRLRLARYCATYDDRFRLLNHYFYATLEEGKDKPHTFLWERAAREMGIELSECVMVGDRYWADILGGNRAGARTVKLLKGRHKDETRDEAYEKKKDVADQYVNASREEVLELMTPDHMISSLYELPALLKQIGDAS